MTNACIGGGEPALAESLCSTRPREPTPPDVFTHAPPANGACVSWVGWTGGLDGHPGRVCGVGSGAVRAMSSGRTRSRRRTGRRGTPPCTHLSIQPRLTKPPPTPALPCLALPCVALQTLVDKERRQYEVTSEMSIEFEVDGPYKVGGWCIVGHCCISHCARDAAVFSG